MTKLFATSLFGYSKKNVGDYIGRMNEEFSQKLLAKDQENKDELQKLKAQVEQLSEENERLRSEQQDVAAVLIDARAYAAELRAKAEEEYQAMRTENSAHCDMERQRLQRLGGNIDALQKAFRKAVRNMEAELETYRIQSQTTEKELEPDASEEQKDKAVQA